MNPLKHPHTISDGEQIGLSIKINELQDIFEDLLKSHIGFFSSTYEIKFNESVNKRIVEEWLNNDPSLILNSAGRTPKELEDVFGESQSIAPKYSHSIILTKDDERNYEYNNPNLRPNILLSPDLRSSNYKERMFKTPKGGHYYSLILSEDKLKRIISDYSLNSEDIKKLKNEDIKKLKSYMISKYIEKFNLNNVNLSELNVQISNLKDNRLYACPSDKVCFHYKNKNNVSPSGHNTILANIGDSFIQRHYHTGSSYNNGIESTNIFLNLFMKKGTDFNTLFKMYSDIHSQRKTAEWVIAKGDVGRVKALTGVKLYNF